MQFSTNYGKISLSKWVKHTSPKANAKVQLAFLKKKFFLLFLKTIFITT